jgi:hypothetical protein
MKCNIPKQKKLPKSFYRLPEYEQRELTEAMNEHSYHLADLHLAEAQEIWIKLDCINLRNCGATEEDLLRYMAGWKRVYANNARMKTKEEQTAWLDEEMKKCFPTCGFPQIRIDELKEKT